MLLTVRCIRAHIVVGIITTCCSSESLQVSDNCVHDQLDSRRERIEYEYMIDLMLIERWCCLRFPAFCW